MKSDAQKVAALVIEAATFGITCYTVWILLPPRVKLTIRTEIYKAMRPVRQMQERHRVHNQMWSDVIQLSTFGVPARWERAV